MIPLWALSLLLTAGSVAARQEQQRKVKHEQEGFSEAERIREGGRQKQRDQALDSSLAQFQPADQAQKIDAAGDKREASFASTSAQGQVVPGEYAGESTAPKEVRTELAGRVADYLNKGREETKRRAKLGAFGDAQFDNNVQLGRTAQQIDTLGDSTRGSQHALDAELTGAQHAGDDWGLFSDLLGAGAMGTSLYSLTQPAAGAAAVNADPSMSGKLWMHNNATGGPTFKFR